MPKKVHFFLLFELLNLILKMGTWSDAPDQMTQLMTAEEKWPN